MLKPQYAGDEQFEQRFRREAATAARLRHPNIIKIFAVGKDGDAVYFAMDFLPQGLPDRLEVMNTLPEPVLIRMGIDVASALGFAHREGVVHRDIKVDNILFDEHGNAIVADFGIARAVSNYVQQTGTNMVVGTPQYFSPEQARGQALDGRADIYSLGVTLYRAAAGVLPFTGNDWYEIARQHVEDRPVRPRARNPNLSRDVERVILRCLEKDPAARFQTGEALCQALAALSLEHSETIAMRSSASPGSSETPTAPIVLATTARRRQWSRRVTGAAVAALVIATLLVAAPAVRRAWTTRNGPPAVDPAHTLAVRPGLTTDSTTAGTAAPDAAIRPPAADAERRSGGSTSSDGRNRLTAAAEPHTHRAASPTGVAAGSTHAPAAGPPDRAHRPRAPRRTT